MAVGALAAGVAAYTLTQKKAVTEADRYYSSCTKLKKKQEEMAASIKSLHKAKSEKCRFHTCKWRSGGSTVSEINKTDEY